MLGYRTSSPEAFFRTLADVLDGGGGSTFTKDSILPPAFDTVRVLPFQATVDLARPGKQAAKCKVTDGDKKIQPC